MEGLLLAGSGKKEERDTPTERISSHWRAASPIIMSMLMTQDVLPRACIIRTVSRDWVFGIQKKCATPRYGKTSTAWLLFRVQLPLIFRAKSLMPSPLYRVCCPNALSVKRNAPQFTPCFLVWHGFSRFQHDKSMNNKPIVRCGDIGMVRGKSFHVACKTHLSSDFLENCFS